MIWTDKLKLMGPHTLSNEGRDGGVVDERVIVTDVSNIKVGEGMAKTPSETPIIVISSDIRTLRDGNCQGHSSLDAPSELNPPQRIPSPLLLHY